MAITIPGIGTLANAEFDWLTSEPVEVPALGIRCTFIVDGFEPAEITRLSDAIQSFLALSPGELRRQASSHVWAYYSDFAAHYAGEQGFPDIAGAGRVWDFITVGHEVWVKRDEAHWYVSVENECAWEPEHGLELVFRDGRQLVKVGQVDTHLTNRRAYGDDSIPDHVVYWSPF